MEWRTDIENAPMDEIVLLYGLLDVLDSRRELYGNLDRPTRVAGYWDSIDEAWCPIGGTWEGPWIKPTHWAKLMEAPK